ncbi:trypsin I-P1-like [Culicoides brevitarsis]|uniref:trypsin I-P1-like n=1 Tax=Culicoides brevitarsis TaxID=469753 RepID=UPI00307CAFB3
MTFDRVVAIFLLVSACHGIIPPSEKATSREAPYFVYISDGYSYCGGAIIQKDVIITAAHCLKEFMTNYKSIEVTAGTTTPNARDKNAQRLSVKDAIVHEGYKLGENGVQAYNDIAIIKLSKPFRASNNLQPIKIARFDPQTTLWVYGYGSTHETFNVPSDELRRKNVTFIPDPDCQKILDATRTKSVKQRYEICMSTSMCHGDSGSPVIQIQQGSPRIVGIASWVADDIYGCDTPPAVAVNVAEFGSWIGEALKKLGRK